MTGGRGRNLLQLAFATILFISGFGCDDGPNAGEISGNVISNQFSVTTVVFGRVTNAEGFPLTGVDVVLLGGNVYSTISDGLGYYRLDDVHIANVRAMIGSGGAGGAVADNQDSITMTATYTLLFGPAAGSGPPTLATFKASVNLTATAYRTGNSYAIETVPTQYDAVLVPFAQFRVHVTTGEADGSGQPVPASGALVEVRPNLGDSLLYETPVAQRYADGAGVASFDGGNRLAAVGGYRIVVLPYDANPEAGDGFEYDTVTVAIDLSPYSPLLEATNGSYPLEDIVINLHDALATNQGPTIAFSQPESGGELHPNQPIYVQFSRPMDIGTIDYELKGCYLACGVGTDLVLLTEELERSPLVLSLLPLGGLSRLFANFSLTIMGQAADGTALNQTLFFTLTRELLPDSVAWVPVNLDLPSINGSTSQIYASAVDFSSIYVFDSAFFDEDAFLGALFATTAGTVGPAMGRPLVDTTLPLRWPAVPEASGYRVYARDTFAVTNWVQIAELGPTALTLLDDDSVTASVVLPAGFDYYSDDAVSTPFCCGNAVMLTVLPYFGNDAMPPIDPNGILVLTDNYGPAIMPTAVGANFDGEATVYSGLEYDRLATIAFSEYLDHAKDPAILSGVDTTPGVLNISGRFTFDWIDWNGMANHTSWHLQLAAPMVPATDLFIGDRLAKTDGTGNCTVTGIDTCDVGQIQVFCDGTEFLGSTFELMGPVRPAANNDRALNFGVIPPGAEFNVSDIPFNATFSTAHLWALNQASLSRVVRPVSVTPTTGEVILAQAVTDSLLLDGTAVFSNSPTRQLTATTPATGAGAVLELFSTQGLIAGDMLAILDSVPSFVESVAIMAMGPGTNEVTVTNLSFTHAAGTSVALYPSSVLSADSLVGDTVVTLQNPNALPSLGFAVGDWVVIDSGPNQELAGVTAVAGSQLTLDTDPADTTGVSPLTLDHTASTTVRLAPAVITVRGIRIGLTSVEGMRPGEMMSIVGPVGTQSYRICALVDDDVLLDRTHQVYLLSNTDPVVPLADSAVRPDDRIQVVIWDAAGNPVREDARFLSGDGTVE